MTDPIQRAADAAAEGVREAQQEAAEEIAEGYRLANIEERISTIEQGLTAPPLPHTHEEYVRVEDFNPVRDGLEALQTAPRVAAEETSEAANTVEDTASDAGDTIADVVPERTEPKSEHETHSEAEHESPKPKRGHVLFRKFGR